ncbi:MAG: hypothetical protein FWC67_03610 [Defluviitaleaceae bacterium]|nr:hypothetical protein [Defluviitaleaceae bacterium]
MENNLKNRYIYAVTRHLPSKIQADVKQELDGLINDMAQAKNGNMGGFPSEQTIREVLTELGSPEELALKYHGGEQKSLIGGTYFLTYKLVLRTVLPIIAAILAALAIASLFIGDAAFSVSFGTFGNNIDATLFARILQVPAIAIGGVLQAFAVITIIFAILSYNKTKISSGKLSDLPEIPTERLRISPLEATIGIIVSVATTVLFLVFPHIIGIMTDFQWIPAFDVGIIRSMWMLILIWGVLELGAEIAKLVEGRYTPRLALLSVIANVIGAILAVVIFSNPDIVNPDFVAHMLYQGQNIEILSWGFDNILSRPNIMIMAVILVVLSIETIDIIIKAFQSKQ